MPKYHIFKGTTGSAQIVTADKTGANLPKHPVGKWAYMKPVTLNRGSRGVGPSHDEAIDAIERDGYYKIPSGKTSPKKQIAPRRHR